MFNQVCEDFRRATEATVQMQQEIFKTWLNSWPVAPARPTIYGEQMQQFQKKWAEAFGETLKRQQEVNGDHFKIGLENLEKTCKLVESKTPEELRAQTIDLWKKCVDDMQKVYQAQMQAVQFATEKWAGLLNKSET
jgi:hypothetical protein